MPTKRKTKAKRKSDGRPKQDPRPRHLAGAFWSGTISFGLVNVPVHLFAGSRHAGVRLRLLDTDGTPLSRKYYCPRHERDVHPEHLVRGYELEDGEYVLVRDEDLEAVEPKKSREIDLRQFVDLDEISPLFFDRPYLLTPAGDSNKAYRLLAEVMQRTRQAGIATFVMRDREYLVAILAENGILRAETLRFQDELRTPDEIGLPAKPKLERQAVSRFAKAIREFAKDEIEAEELRDERTVKLLELAEKKRKSGKDVVESEEYEATDASEVGETPDLLENIRRSLAGENGSVNSKRRRIPEKHTEKHEKHTAEEFEGQSKEKLYERAKKLDISGRASMNKQQLIRALRRQ